jgi:HSP20 family molecular chaperone IbpA
MIEENEMNITFEFPERLWKRPMELHDGKARPRVAAASYNQGVSHPLFEDDTAPIDQENESEVEQPGKALGEPQVKVSTEAGNARVTVELPSADKKDLRIHCAENTLTLSIETQTGSWVKEIPLPFRVDPDTAKAVFRNKKLELIVRKHGSFNPPRPKIDWV